MTKTEIRLWLNYCLNTMYYRRKEIFNKLKIKIENNKEYLNDKTISELYERCLAEL